MLQNWSLRRIVLKAYEIKDYALTAPDWLASLTFDINAKTTGPVTETGLDQMLKTLLIERFHLKAHTIVQDKQAYLLLTAKNGFKPKPVKDGSPAIDDCDLSRYPEKTSLSCRHASLGYLAEVLSAQLNSIVVDRSEVKATYAFTLEWSPNPGGVAPSIFTALQEQLGLRLDRRKVPVSILVVENIGKTPAGN